MAPKKGGKKKRKDKKPGDGIKRYLETKGESEEYAKITKLLGDRRVKITLADNQSTLGIIPGKFRKRLWMNIGDIVLVNKRDYQDDKCDIIYKYNPDEVNRLYRMKEIPEFFIDGIAKHEEDIAGDDQDVIMRDDEEDNDDVKNNKSNEIDLPPSDSENDSEESDLDIDNI